MGLYTRRLMFAYLGLLILFGIASFLVGDYQFVILVAILLLVLFLLRQLSKNYQFFDDRLL